MWVYWFWINYPGDIISISVLPTKLQILNVTNIYTVKGIEHSSLDRICLVKKGKPPGVLRWRKNGTIIRLGGSSKLVYSFVPNENDHQSVYSCKVQNTFMEKPLKKTIHLDIQCKHSTTLSYKNFLNPNSHIWQMCTNV